MDHVVLDDPALGPVGADEPGLVGSGRGPRAGRLRELEAAYGDVVDVVLGGGEHRLAHVDLRELGVGVGAAEVGPDRRGVRADLGVPDEPGLLGVAHPVGRARPVVGDLGAQRRVGHLVAGAHLVEAEPVQVDLAEVPGQRRLGLDEPVARDLLREGVPVAEQRVGHRRPPHVPRFLLPARHPLRSLDHDVLAGRGLVGDAPRGTQPAAPRLHPLPVLASVHQHGVARPGEVRRPADRAQRAARGTVLGIVAVRRHVQGRHRLLLFHLGIRRLASQHSAAAVHETGGSSIVSTPSVRAALAFAAGLTRSWSASVFFA